MYFISTANGDVKKAPGMEGLLAKWRKSQDVTLRSHAIRATAVLGDSPASLALHHTNNLTHPHNTTTLHHTIH